MTRRRGFGRAVVVAALVSIPATAVAAQGARVATAPAPPQAGLWKTISAGYNHTEFTATFTVTKNHYLTGLHGTLTSEAETACGPGTAVTVTGRQRIFDAKGVDAEGAYNEYAVGKNEPGADPVIQPINVELTHNGQPITGKLYIVFPEHGSLGGGAIEYLNGNCDIQFAIKKG
jgi:hypothetical protein